MPERIGGHRLGRLVPVTKLLLKQPEILTECYNLFSGVKLSTRSFCFTLLGYGFCLGIKITFP